MVIDEIGRALANFVRNDLPVIVEAEGLSFIKKNFKDEGFNDGGLKKWQARKTLNKKGKDITKYRTNRVGRSGSLNQYGRRNQGRALLTGHKTGGNKLRNSFRASATPNEVKFTTDKVYAEAHNDGNKVLPKRQFIGKSAYLESKIKAKITKELNKIFKQ